MQREMVMSPPYWTVGQTVDHLRSLKQPTHQDFYLIMVVDAHFHPVGEINVGRLYVRTDQCVFLKLWKQILFGSCEYGSGRGGHRYFAVTAW